MRFLAAFLLLAHLGSIAGPAMLSLRGGEASHTCVSSQTHADMLMVAEGPGECEMCETMGCTHMLACSGVSAAVISSGTLVLVEPLLVSSSIERAQGTTSVTAVPLAPPPKA